MRSRAGLWLLVIVIAAALCRVVFAGWVVGWEREPIGDEIDYHALASSVAEGDGLSRDGRALARRPPLYPIVLGAVYRVAGQEPVIGRILQVLLGTLVVVLVFAVARMYFSRSTAWLATLLVAFNPFLIFISGYLLTENLYMILLLAGLVVLRPGLPDRSLPWPNVITLGVLLALAAMARPTAVPIGVWIAVGFLLWSRGDLRGRIARAVVLVASIFVVLTPWAARNHHIFGKWLFFTTHGGITFYQGNNPRILDVPQYRGGVAPLHMLPGIDALDELVGIERDEAAYAMGKAFLREHPQEIPRLWWWKFQRFWRFRSDAGMSGVKSGWWWSKDSFLGRAASELDVGLAFTTWVIPLFLVGLVWTWRKYRWYWVLYGFLIAHTAVTLLFHGSLRMRIPIEPVIAMFAAAALVRIAARIRRQPVGGASSPAGGAQR